VLAATLALALALGSASLPGERGTPASSRRAPAAGKRSAKAPPAGSGLGADNAVRARRGLLPRKERRAPPAKTHLVYRAPPPVYLDVWLDEARPAEPEGPAPVPAAATATAALALPEEIGDGQLHASLEAARVEILLVRRRSGVDGEPLVEATVEGALVDALLVQHREPEP
jgi:hypothetical protein